MKSINSVRLILLSVLLADRPLSWGTTLQMKAKEKRVCANKTSFYCHVISSAVSLSLCCHLSFFVRIFKKPFIWYSQVDISVMWGLFFFFTASAFWWTHWTLVVPNYTCGSHMFSCLHVKPLLNVGVTGCMMGKGKILPCIDVVLYNIMLLSQSHLCKNKNLYWNNSATNFILLYVILYCMHVCLCVLHGGFICF